MTYTGSLKLARVGVLTPLKLANVINQGFFPPEILLFISSPLRSPAWAGSLDTAEVGSILLFPWICSLLPQHNPRSCSILGHHLVLWPSLPSWNFLLLQHHLFLLHCAPCGFLKTIHISPPLLWCFTYGVPSLERCSFSPFLDSYPAKFGRYLLFWENFLKGPPPPQCRLDIVGCWQTVNNRLSRKGGENPDPQHLPDSECRVGKPIWVHSSTSLAGSPACLFCPAAALRHPP